MKDDRFERNWLMFIIIRNVFITTLFIGLVLLGWFGLYELIACCGETNKDLVGAIVAALVTLGMMAIVAFVLGFFEDAIDNTAVDVVMKIDSYVEWREYKKRMKAGERRRKDGDS